MKNAYLSQRYAGALLGNHRRNLSKIVCILALLTVFCINYVMILPAVTQERTALPSLTNDGAYISDFIINRIHDGVAPFDTENADQAGNDANDSNKRVRTFDTIIYNLYSEIGTYDNCSYGEARVKFQFVLPLAAQEACFDESAMAWMDQTPSYSPRLTTEYRIINGVTTSCQVLTCYKHLLSNEFGDAVLPGTFAENVVINVKSMKNHAAIAPVFSVCMEKGEWNNDICETHNRQEKFTVTADTVTVTAAPKYNIKLAGSGAYKSTFDFNSGNTESEPLAANYYSSKTYAVGRAMTLGITLQLYGDNESKGLKGVELPDGGPITFQIDVNSKYTYDDADGTKTAEVTDTYTPLLWSCDSNSRTEYGDKNADGRIINYNQGSALGFAPLADGGGKNACFNSGKWSAVQNGSVITVTVKDYIVNTDSLPINNGDGTKAYGANVGCFSAGELWIVQPFNRTEHITTPISANDPNEIETEYATGGTFSTTVKASNLSIKSLSGQMPDKQQVTSDDMKVMTLGIYQAGAFVNRIKYAQKDYIDAGLGVNAEAAERARDGQDVATIGTRLRLHGGFSYSSDNQEQNQLYFGTNLTKFYGNAFKIVKTDAECIKNHSDLDDKNFKVLYATKKDGTDWKNDEELQTTYEDDLDFYDEYNNIPENKLCVGILFCFKGPNESLDSVKYYMGSVLVEIPADKELAGKAYMLVSTSRLWTKSMFEKEERTLDNLPDWADGATSLSDFPAEHYKSANIEGSTFYIKETYADDGSGAIGTHNSDWAYWGDTLYISGYRAVIEKSLSQKTENGEPKNTYALSQNQRVVDFTLSPDVWFDSGIDGVYYETVTVVDTLPKYLTYRPGSCYVGGTYNQIDLNGESKGTVTGGILQEPVVENKEDGTQTLTWVFENQRITKNTKGAGMKKIYYSAYIGSNNPENDLPSGTTFQLINSAVIYAPLDMRTPTKANFKYADVGISVIRGEASAYGKYVKQNVVEPTGTIDYVLYYNNNMAVSTEVLMFDAMPANGINSSRFTGGYNVAGWKLNVDRCDMNKLSFYYTLDSDYAGGTIQNLGGETEAKSKIKKNWIKADIAADGTVSAMNGIQPTAWALLGTLDGNNSIYIDLQIKLNPASSQDKNNYFVNTLSVNNMIITAETHTVLRSLEGIAWLDSNSDGIRNNAEEPLNDVKVSLYKFGEGTIFTSDTADPQLILKEDLFSDLTADKLKCLRITVSGITAGQVPQLFYKMSGQDNFLEKQSIKLSESVTAAETELVFNFSSDLTNWQGDIRQLRIDPINLSNESFTVKNVVLELTDGRSRVYDLTEKDAYKSCIITNHIGPVSYPDVDNFSCYYPVNSSTGNNTISCVTGKFVSVLNASSGNYEAGRYKFTDLSSGIYGVKFENSENTQISAYIASPVNCGNDLFDSDGIAVYSADRTVLNYTYITGIQMPDIADMSVTAYNSPYHDSGFYRRGYKLPDAGDSGSLDYIAAGLLLCGLAGILYIYNYPIKRLRNWKRQ